MKYFSDRGIPKNSSICITNLINNITTKDHSHKGGWTKLLKCQLVNAGYDNVTIIDKSHKVNDFDCLIFDLGAEFSGSINMFGGLDINVYERLCELSEFKGSMFSWKNNIPDISDLEKRRNNVSTCEEFISSSSDFIHNLNHKLQTTVKTFDHVYFCSNILIGDSHTPSVWTPDYMIDRRDGRTLAGMVANNTVERVISKLDSGIDGLFLYAGNIDIRHHLMREKDPIEATKKLANGALSLLQGRSPTMSLLLPPEDSSRVLPKTGYYKGTPFFGSWEERSNLVDVFNSIIKPAVDTYQHPDCFYDMYSALPFDVMERPKSVHISPMYYRWDLDNNKARY